MSASNDCLFCKIVAGEIPCAKLLEDDSALAFLDINPIVQGHALLIPKPHVETLAELNAETAGAVLRHLPALAGALRKATGCEGLNVLQNNGQLAGQVVPHVHFHLLPRSRGDGFDYTWPAGQSPPGRLDELAEAVRQVL